MTTKKNKQPAASTAKLEGPLHRNNGEELVTLTRQQVSNIQQSTQYPNQPPVQAAATVLLTNTDAYEKTLAAIGQKRKEIDALSQIRDTQRATVLRGRGFLQATITTAAQGNLETIQALNCTIATRTATVQSTIEAPMHLTLKNSPTIPGTISAKCKAVRGGASYTFVFTTDPNAPPGVGTTVTSTKSRCEITGQQLGHVLYARVSVVRTVGGPSAWSDPAQTLVR